MIDISRRSFLGGSTALVAGGFASSWQFPRALLHSTDGNPEVIPESVIFTILNTTLDAARSAGASYAEVSMDRYLGQTIGQRDQYVTGIGLANSESFHVGVRVLVNGRWGHASSNQFEDTELIRLAKAAVSQGKANSRRRPREMDWTNGHATVGRYITEGVDPFSVPLEEKVDFLNSWRTTVQDFRSPTYAAAFGDCKIGYWRTERGYVNTNGCRQYSMVYGCFGELPLAGSYKNEQALSGPPTVGCTGLHLQQGGWDIIRNARPHDQIPKLVEHSAAATMIGMSPVDVGRYDIVCDAITTANIIGETVVRASELDRAIGYEANAGGTSYLGPNPHDHLGAAVASPLVTISANRDLPRGMATIPWDSEGMPVKSFDLVRDGKLVDYITNRELAPMLDQWYARTGKPVGSNGCAYHANSGNFPLPGIPNIRIHPGAAGADVKTLIAGVKRGYYLAGAGVSTSFQCQDGYVSTRAREIVNGKLGNYVKMGIMFNTTELLKGVTAVGEASTKAEVPFQWRKGQPMQGGYSTIESVPMVFSNVPVIDPERKA